MDTVRIYSLRDSGNVPLSANFRVKEFACNDGTDVVIVDIVLVWILQMVRNHFRKPVTITSAYRTHEYNKKIGGASASLHLYGMAADFTVDGVPASEVQEYCEMLLANCGGIGKAKNYTHIDTRKIKSRWTY